MVRESKKFSKNCYWFSTLVSKQSNLKGIYKSLKKIEANQIKTIPMGTGNKSSRIIAWTFLSKEEQKEWRETRWKIQ
jgi:23S rRNA (adenine1618-N6)-methyltransferase